MALRGELIDYSRAEDRIWPQNNPIKEKENRENIFDFWFDFGRMLPRWLRNGK
jgi:hypothetical protein